MTIVRRNCIEKCKSSVFNETDKRNYKSEGLFLLLVLSVSVFVYLFYHLNLFIYLFALVWRTRLGSSAVDKEFPQNFASNIKQIEVN